MVTLATTTAVLVLLACLFFGWPDAGVQGADKVDIAVLRKTLQKAIELEWATIPPYLNAALSIKDPDGTNKQVSDMLWGILGNEMDHMALAANMLNAIGGAPVLNDPNIAPRYPGPLPAGCLPHLTVTLEKMTRSHTEKVFMGIETPECEDSVTTFHGHLSKAASSEPSNKMTETFEAAFPGLLAKCAEVDFSPDTIGAIYIHKILCPMLKLEMEARRSQGTIFTGNLAHQVSIPPSVFKVSNLTTAIKAIALIVSQGEGGDPCNPYVDADFAGDKKKEPCHYFKFAQIVHGMEVEAGGNPCPPSDPGCKDYFSPCDGNPCENIQFSGPKVPFTEDDVWPILSNPSTGRYPPGSYARRLSDAFNLVYVDIMQCLHKAVNGQPDKLKADCADKYMVALRSIGEKLVKTPIVPGGDPNKGPNAAPTYEFYHGAQEIRDDFQQQQRIEL